MSVMVINVILLTNEVFNKPNANSSEPIIISEPEFVDIVYFLKNNFFYMVCSDY